MATRNEIVTLTESDLKSAIKDFLSNKYRVSGWNIQLNVSKSTSGQGWAETDTERFSATATREVKEEDD